MLAFSAGNDFARCTMCLRAAEWVDTQFAICANDSDSGADGTCKAIAGAHAVFDAINEPAGGPGPELVKHALPLTFLP